MKESRYILEIDMYIYSKSDKKAIKKAEKIIKKLNDKYDGKAEIINLVSNDYGSQITKEIK